MKKLQHPRANTANNDGYTGLESQLTVDTSRWEIRLHDAETPGGHRILNLSQLIEIFMQLDSEFGNVSFGPDERGYLVRVGDRQYALRELIAGTGITITEGKATGGNTTIAVSPGFLDAGVLAGKLPYALTTGTASALLADLPNGWPNDVDGAVAILKLHVAPANGATLKIDDYTARNLLTARGSNKLATAMKINDIIMVVRVGDNFHAIGVDIPANINIEAIVGLTATDIQAALAELLGKIPGTGGTLTDPFAGLFNLGPLGAAGAGGVTHTDINIAAGEYRCAVGMQRYESAEAANQREGVVAALFTKIGANYYVTTSLTPVLDAAEIPSRGSFGVYDGVVAGWSSGGFYRTAAVWTNLGSSFTWYPQPGRLLPRVIGTKKAGIYPNLAV